MESLPIVVDSPVTSTSPAKAAEKSATTPVKVEISETKKSDSEFKITSPEISKEIKIELEDVKKMEKDENKKKKGKKEETTEKMDKEDNKEKKLDKAKGKGKKKKEPEEKEVKEESDSEKRTEKKVEGDKKKTKKKLKKKSDDLLENEVTESVAVLDTKGKQDDTKLEKSEKAQKPDVSKPESVFTGDSDSVKPLTSLSSPKQLVSVVNSQEPKEVPGHSPRPNRDVHKPEESELKPVPESSTSSHIHHQASIHLPNVPSHSGVFDPMALLAHVSSTAQAAATNTVFQNTPPDTPERSPHVLSHGGLSPEQDSNSLRSDGDAGLESETIAGSHAHHLPHGGESPTTCDTSTLSNGSSAGSSGNVPSSESGTEAAPASSTAKRKSTAADEEEEEESDLKPAKKKRRGHKRQSHGTAGQSDRKSSHKHHPHHSSKHNCNCKCSLGYESNIYY